MLYALLLFVNFLYPQQQETRVFELLDTQAGLSNNIVYDIHKDREGFIWIATDNGLNRYDGYSFKKFYHNASDTISLSSNVIRRIVEDQEGNLWIGTKNGLNLYDRETERFSRYQLKDNSVVPILDLQQMIIDNSDKIWFTTLLAFGYFDVKTKKFQIVDPELRSFSITRDDHDAIWVESRGGELNSIQSGSSTFKRHLYKEAFYGRHIHYGVYSKHLWIPDLFAKDSLEIPFKLIPKLPNNIQPTRLKEIDEHTLLIGSNDGLFEYDVQNSTLNEVQLSTSPSTLRRQIRSIFKDKNGGIWIGSLGGVFYYDDHKNTFDHLKINKDSDDIVMGLEFTRKGLYANALGKGLYFKPNDSRKFERLDINNALSGAELFIWDVEEVANKEYPIWLASDAGLILFNPKTGKTKRIELPLSDEQVRVSFNMYNSNLCCVYVAFRSRIYVLDKKTAELKRSFILDGNFVQSPIQVMTRFDDTLILGSESEGLYALNEKTGDLMAVKFREIGESKPQLFKTAIWDLHVYNDQLWIGTGRGLFQMKKGEQFATPALNVNQIVFSIAHDQNKNLWMGTERGLMSYGVGSETVRSYGYLDGLENVEFNRRSVVQRANGELWFGGVNGITHFDPLKIKENTIIPPVHITDLRVITADSVIQVAHREKKVVLPHDHNTLELDYVTLNYTNSTQNQYKHQMVGHDPSWVVDDGRKARYVKLPKGNYTFKVIASNNDGLWNEVGDQIQIQVLPPYWETWWFRSLVLFMIAGLIYFLYKYRVNKLLEMERMKLRIASDLHDEVGSGLSGIALTSDILEQQVENGNIKPHLVSRITKNARNLASTLDDIVWLINPEKEKFGDFVIKTKTVAQELLPKVDVSFEEEIQEGMRNKILNSEFKRHLLLFVKEVIHNIAKHANASEVYIVYKVKDGRLKLTITDNGIGFDLNNETSGNGLISLKNRIKEIDGVLDISSEKNRWTTITASMKIP